MEQKHFVEFDVYCPICKHFSKDQNEYPCYECLTVSVRENSRIPEKWEDNNKNDA